MYIKNRSIEALYMMIKYELLAISQQIIDNKLDKIHFLVFTKKFDIHLNMKLYLNNKAIQRQHETKFLGLTIYNLSLERNHYINNIPIKITKHNSVIYLSRKILNTDVSLIQPHLPFVIQIEVMHF